MHAHMHAHTRTHTTALFQAAIDSGSSDQLSRLLQIRADPNQAPATSAIWHRTLRITFIARELGAPHLHLQALSSGHLPLGAAVATGSLAAAATLLTYGAGVHDVDARGMTALHHAALHANTPLIQLLLSSGASMSALNTSGLRPAELTSDLAALALLADAADDEVEEDDEHGESPVSPAEGTATPAALNDEEGPPPYPPLPLGEFATAPEALPADALLRELQSALGLQAHLRTFPPFPSHPPHSHTGNAYGI